MSPTWNKGTWNYYLTQNEVNLHVYLSYNSTLLLYKYVNMQGKFYN